MFRRGDIIRALNDDYGYTDVRTNYIGVVLEEEDDDGEICVQDIFLTNSGDVTVKEFRNTVDFDDDAQHWYVEANEYHFELLTLESLNHIYNNTHMTYEQRMFILNAINNVDTDRKTTKKKYYTFNELLKGVV